MLWPSPPRCRLVAARPSGPVSRFGGYVVAVPTPRRRFVAASPCGCTIRIHVIISQVVDSTMLPPPGG
eukprot:5538279-Pyramimonas_sp.AAC.1